MRAYLLCIDAKPMLIVTVFHFLKLKELLGTVKHVKNGNPQEDLENILFVDTWNVKIV